MLLRRKLVVAILILVFGWNLQNLAKYGREFERGTRNPAFHFPSKEDRVKYYMGSWYDISSNSLSWNTTSFCNDVPYYDRNNPDHQTRDKAMIFDRYNIGKGHYEHDIKNYLLPSFYSLASIKKKKRFAISMGDKHPMLQHPTILKSREIKTNHTEQTMVPILALMNENRHYKKVRLLQWGVHDIPWEWKKASLVWRGGFTGNRGAIVEHFLKNFNHNTTSIPIDVTMKTKENTNSISIPEQLRSKYLLSLEGNDVASGLKWMLYSNSVVFMPPPTHVSWAMEDKLEPYYHYIPVAPDLSDLQEKVKWAYQHDDECRKIAKHATEYINDLYVSRQAKQDNRWILEEIVRRYQNQFGDIVSSCPPQI